MTIFGYDAAFWIRGWIWLALGWSALLLLYIVTLAVLSALLVRDPKTEE